MGDNFWKKNIFYKKYPWDGQNFGKSVPLSGDRISSPVVGTSFEKGTPLVEIGFEKSIPLSGDRILKNATLLVLASALLHT